MATAAGTEALTVRATQGADCRSLRFFGPNAARTQRAAAHQSNDIAAPAHKGLAPEVEQSTYSHAAWRPDHGAVALTGLSVDGLIEDAGDAASLIGEREIEKAAFCYRHKDRQFFHRCIRKSSHEREEADAEPTTCD